MPTLKLDTIVHSYGDDLNVGSDSHVNLDTKGDLPEDIPHIGHVLICLKTLFPRLYQITCHC